MPSLRIIGLAQRSGVGLQLGCHPGETGLLSAAGRHVASHVRGLRYVEGSYDRHVLAENLTTEDITFCYGGWAAPLPGPAWGSRSTPSALERMTVRHRGDLAMTEPRVGDPGRVRRLPDPRRGLAGAGARYAGGWSCCTASRAMAAGITAWAGRLAEAGYEAHFPDRRGSGANRERPRPRPLGPPPDRRPRANGSRRSATRDPRVPIALAGISWGGKLAVDHRRPSHPELVDALALICPGLQPRVGVSLGERLRIALAFFTNRRKTFPIPLSDPALFTANPEGQAFIAADLLGLHAGTAGLLAASSFIDRGRGVAAGGSGSPCC